MSSEPGRANLEGGGQNEGGARRGTLYGVIRYMASFATPCKPIHDLPDIRTPQMSRSYPSKSRIPTVKSAWV